MKEIFCSVLFSFAYSSLRMGRVTSIYLNKELHRSIPSQEFTTYNTQEPSRRFIEHVCTVHRLSQVVSLKN